MKAVIVKAKGEGGFLDPSTGQYVSSQKETVAPLTGWLENMINHDKVELVEELGPDYDAYAKSVLDNDSDPERGLAEYRKNFVDVEAAKEPVIVASTPAEVDEQEAENAEHNKPRHRGRQPKADESPSE